MQAQGFVNHETLQYVILYTPGVVSRRFEYNSSEECAVTGSKS